MTFLNENIRFESASEFSTYLSSLTKPRLVIGSTYHNTYVPDINSWNGSSTMNGMESHYVSLGWDRGPHCFIASGSPSPLNDGIWVMTPPNVWGIHAGVCNGSDTLPWRWGIELVGDFNLNAPDRKKLDLLAQALAALHLWVGINAEINAHRDCMPGRTCPGDAFYGIKSTVISMVINEMASDPWKDWGTIYPLPIDQRKFGIPTAWFPNRAALGMARSWPVYSGDSVIQLFERGQIVFRNGLSRVILYKDFRVP